MPLRNSGDDKGDFFEAWENFTAVIHAIKK